MIRQLCIKPLVLPQAETGYQINTVYRFDCVPVRPAFSKMFKFRKPGDYTIEYWYVTDCGTESDHNQAIFKVEAYKHNCSMHGFRMLRDIFEDSHDMCLDNDRFEVSFKRHGCGLGEDFKWEDLDLDGLAVKESGNQCVIEIAPGSWLARQLNNCHRSFDITVKGGKQLSCNGMLLTEKNGKMKNNLPNFLKYVVANCKMSGNGLSFTICKTGKYIVTL